MFLLLAIALVQNVSESEQCSKFTNCSSCVAPLNGINQCGWCDSLQMCLPGTRDGADDYTPCPEPTPLIHNWWKFAQNGDAGVCDWWDLDCTSSSSSTPLMPGSGVKQAESRMEMFLLVILTCIVLLVLVIVCVHLVKLSRLQRQQQHPLGIPLI